MKKKLLLVSCFVLYITTSFGQLTKHNWLVGGNALFSYRRTNTLGATEKSIHISISPTIGYFFLDRVAAGMRPSLGYTHLTTSGTKFNTTQITFGPFARYYFFNTDKVLNLLAEASYQYARSLSSNSNSDYQQLYTVSAGPVIYFNSSIGMECLLNYQHLDEHSATANSISLGIGFQIHLEREKN